MYLLKHLITLALNSQGATAQQKELIEHTVTVCAQENMELACAIIQKTAMEKALVQMDKHLTTVSQFFSCPSTSVQVF